MPTDVRLLRERSTCRSYSSSGEHHDIGRGRAVAIRHLVAALVLAFVIGKTLRDPKFGVLAFVVILFMDPSSLFWGFDQWHIPLVTSITVLTATVLHFHKRNKRLGGGAIFFWVAALTIWLAVSTMDSVNVERSYRIFVDYWIKTFVFCWLFMLWIRNERDLRLFFSVVIGCFLLLALRAIYRYNVGYPEIAGLAGTMQDRNDFALHLMMVVPFAYAMYRTTKDWRLRLMLFGSIVLTYVCVLLTYSRMGFLLMILAGLLFFWSSESKLKVLIRIVGPVLVLLVLIVPESYVERIETIRTYHEDQSATGRIEAWIAGIEMGKDNLVTGVGLKCFELPEVYFKYAEGIPRVAHNAYVQLFSEAGLPALLSWLFLMMTGLFGARALRREDVSMEIRTYATAIQHALLLYLVASMFLNSAYFELPYLVLASFVVLRKVARPSDAETTVGDSPKKIRWGAPGSHVGLER